MRSLSFRSWLRIPVVGAALLAGLVLAGCGDNVTATAEQHTTVSTPFSISESDDGQKSVVGHAVTFDVPDNWVDYGSEQESTDASTTEWAVGLPDDGTQFPSGVQLSAGVSGHGGQVRSHILEAATKIAELEEGYEYLDSGDVEVPGTDLSQYLRYQMDMDLNGTVTRVEQVSLFLQVDDRTTTTLRFIAPVDEWDSQMKPVYDSVEVAKS